MIQSEKNVGTGAGTYVHENYIYLRIFSFSARAYHTCTVRVQPAPWILQKNLVMNLYRERRKKHDQKCHPRLRLPVYSTNVNTTTHFRVE